MTREQIEQIVKEALNTVRARFSRFSIELAFAFPRKENAIPKIWEITLQLAGDRTQELITVTETDESTHDSIKEDIIREIEGKLPQWVKVVKGT